MSDLDRLRAEAERGPTTWAGPLPRDAALQRRAARRAARGGGELGDLGLAALESSSSAKP